MAVQTQILHRRGTAATWTSTNPTLGAGEIGYETDTGKFKIGDGSTAWASLTYFAVSPLTTKGDIWTYTTDNARLGVGSNGTLLVADSAETPGIKWSNTVNNINVTSSTIPANGIYLPAANTLGLATNSAVRLQINSVGEVAFGGSTVTAASIYATKNITGNAFSQGLFVTGPIQSDVTSRADVVLSRINTAAGSFTITNSNNFFADANTLGSGSAITTMTGFWADSTLIRGTNNYGFFGNIPSGTGRYNLYMAGTADNYMAGVLGIGGTAAATESLRIAKNQTGGVTTYGVRNRGVIQSDVTSSAQYYNTSTETQSAVFTLSNLYHYIAQQLNASYASVTAGGAVTNQYGFAAGSNLTGATNNYGFLGSIPSGTGRYNLYMSGTADNYLAGALGIGTTSLTNFAIRNSKGITGNATSYAYYTDSTIASDVTTSGRYLSTFAQTANANFSLTEIMHYHTNASTTFANVTAGGAVTNQYGLFINANLTGATNNYGVYCNIASGSNRWNFYANNTAANYFAGQTTVGSTSLTLGNGSVAQQFGVVSAAAANVVSVIKGAASQTGNLTEWQDSAGNILANVTSAGRINATVFGNASSGKTYVNTGASADTNSWTFVTNGAGNKGIVVSATASQSANLQEWQNSSGTILARVSSAGAITGVSATAGIGYSTGAGGTVTQLTSKATGVTLNTVSGQITMNTATLNANTTVSFTLTNSAIAAGDVLILNHISGGTAGSYLLNAQSAAGSATINVRNITAGNLGEAIVIAYAVIKAVTA